MGEPTNQTRLSVELCLNWQLAEANPDSVTDPSSSEFAELNWSDAQVPGTVACAKVLKTDSQDLDDFDWWYRCEFDSSDEALTVSAQGLKTFLCLDGLASIADVWLNGSHLLRSDNMFVGHRLDISQNFQEKNELVICFRSLNTQLKIKRPRPRWKTKLVANQNLRWYRTTLLGRIPTWYPRLSPVGPWQPVSIEQVRNIEVIDTRVHTSLDGSKGQVDGEFTIELLSSEISIQQAILRVGSQEFTCQVSHDTNTQNRFTMTVSGEIDNVAKWWPHTHGEPALYDCSLELETDSGSYSVDLGRRGFKSVTLIQDKDNCGFAINDIEVFCRGAVWSSNDLESLRGDQEGVRRALLLARNAGFNMIRVGGTMCYETDEFYRCCDELGLMVWQDFMFASMDYPLDDDEFRANVETEVLAQVSRLASHDSICVYCGNSDVQQQAAMVGAPKEAWSHDVFDKGMKSICEAKHPGIPYFSSTPCGGALPFHPNEGLAHYYGVGAFMLPLSDLYRANIKFAPEGMGFSHVPETSMVNKIFSNETPVLHDPRWKAVVPRDAGAGWDFEDVRDHYFLELYKQDPIKLRCYDPERYLEISRVVSGEIHYRVFTHLRSNDHPCRGALLWYYNDLVAGPGWGMIDSEKNPKAAYFALKKAFSSVGVFIEDKGLNGLYLNFINETAQARNCVVEVKAYKEGDILTLEGSDSVTLAARENTTISVDGMLEYFSDASYAYKFGPVQHTIVHARLNDAETGAYIDDCTFFPVSYTLPIHISLDLTIELIRKETGEYAINVSSLVFLQFVRLDLKSFNVEDNYFHLAPGFAREIILLDENFEPLGGEEPPTVKGFLEAINLREPIRVRL